MISRDEFRPGTRRMIAVRGSMMLTDLRDGSAQELPAGKEALLTADGDGYPYLIGDVVVQRSS